MLLGVFSPVLGNRFGGYSAEGGLGRLFVWGGGRGGGGGSEDVVAGASLSLTSSSMWD